MPPNGAVLAAPVVGRFQLMMPARARRLEALPQRRVVRQQRRRQAKLGGVGHLQGRVKIGHADHLQQGAEPLFVRDAFRVGDVDDAGRDQARLRVELAHLQQGGAALGDHLRLRLHQAFCHCA